MKKLSGKDRRTLRALGHHLKPVVQVGREGMSSGLVEAASSALSDHELIKVRVLESSPLDREAAANELAEATGSELAQLLGRTFLLYKPDPKDPQIEVAGRRRKPAAPPPPRGKQGPGGKRAAAGDAPARTQPKTGKGRRPAAPVQPEDAPMRQREHRPTGASLPPRRHRK